MQVRISSTPSHPPPCPDPLPLPYSAILTPRSFFAAPEAYSRHGTVVVVYTHLGEITLDGEAVSFHETLSGAFSRAGFAIDTNGRRLLGVVEMLGLFKLIRSAANASGSGGGGAGAGPGQLSSQLPIAPPASYYAEVTETDLCQNEQGASTNSCESNGRRVGREDGCGGERDVKARKGMRSDESGGWVPRQGTRDPKVGRELEGPARRTSNWWSERRAGSLEGGTTNRA